MLLSDYLHPTLMETPVDIRVGHVETPSPFTEYGIKGGGEGGRMGAPPAIAAAVEGRAQAARHQGGFAPAHAQGAARHDPAKRSRTRG